MPSYSGSENKLSKEIYVWEFGEISDVSVHTSSLILLFTDMHSDILHI
jgi:hypothetical protein